MDQMSPPTLDPLLPGSVETTSVSRSDPVDSSPPQAKGMLESVVVLSDHGWINGGQAEMAIESALQLKARGLDVCFIAGAGPIDDRLLQAGVECHRVGDNDVLSDPNRLRAAGRGIWNFPAARLLSDCLERRDPRATVIHVHGWAKALSPSIGPVVTQSAAAHVYTLHDYFLGCPNGGFYDYRANAICKRRALGFDCLTTRCDSRAESHKAWRVARQLVLKTASHMPDQLREIIYIAPEQRSVLGPYLPADANWHYLANPVGPQPAERIVAEQNELFLFIGRLSPEKGPEIAALAAMQAGVPLAFCGAGRSFDSVRDTNPDAQMLGWLGKDELSNWIKRARCLVFPSLWYEGYPLVVANALREGLPVIVSKSSMAASSITDEVDGLHVVAGDVGAWAEAMSRLKSDNLVRRFSEAAFRAGKQLLGYDEYTCRLMQIYEKALSRKQAHLPHQRSVVP